MRKLYQIFSLIIVLLCLCLQTWAQQMNVTGVVLDNEGLPVIGGTVTIKEVTGQGTITDMDGNFHLDVAKGQTLIFSYIGFKNQEITIGSQSHLKVKLLPDLVDLGEVVVVGYAQQSRAKVISSVSTVKSDELKNIPSVSAVQALQGKVAGASIPVTSGQPGETPRIVIRGGTTLDPYSNANPLYIIDGVFRDMKDINPDDIESIQIMKDAASTAIYGARASNGVVVVKTKSGKTSSKAEVSFRYQHGIETQARKYDYLNARDYIQLARTTMMRGLDGFNVDAMLFNGSANSASIRPFTQKGEYGRYKFTTAYLDNIADIEGKGYVDNLLANGWETMDDPAAPGKTILFKDSHYQDVIWNTAHTNNYNTSVTGGSDISNYNVSLGYVDQGGVFLGTGYKRFSALANGGYQVFKNLKIDVNTSYSWNDNQYSDDYLRDFTRSTRIPPLNRLYNDDGTPNLGEANNPRNRLHQLYYQDNNVNTTHWIGRIGVDYEIINGLHYRPSASLNAEVATTMNFEKFYPEQARPRDKYQRMQKKSQIMTDHVLMYNQAFGVHNMMVLAGFNYTLNNKFWVLGQSQRSATDYIGTITGDPTSTIINGVVTPNMDASSLFEETKSASFFGQANYDYKGKYMVGASLRRDGFSNFAPENRFATFPSVSAGWNIHEEEFWTKNSIINQAKARISWGQTGLSDLNMVDTYGQYKASRYGTYSGILRDNLPNLNLLWETTESFDAGMDFAFFDYRLKVVVDYYSKTTRDRLTTYPLPGETGFNSIKYNVGAVRNRGIEIELDANILDVAGFRWDSHFTFAFNRAIITELPDNGRDNNRIDGGLVYDPKSGKEIEAGGYAVGERPQSLWAFQSNGIFATDEEAAASDIVDTGISGAVKGKPKHAGDVNWADLNNDKIIDGKDLVLVGYRSPDKTGGWQNTFSWKGLSVRFTMDYAMGHVISNGALARSMGQSRANNEGAPAEALQDKTWKKQGDIATYPRFSFGDYDIGYRNHQRQIGFTGYKGMGHDAYGVDNTIYYSKGDFLAFRELSFSYMLPSNASKVLGCSRIVLNTGIYNLGYLTAYDGLNPETYDGNDEGGYPRPRQITFGASVTF